MSRPRHIPAHCPQLRTADLVARYGFTERHWRKLAAEGRIPGATHPAGLAVIGCLMPDYSLRGGKPEGGRLHVEYLPQGQSLVGLRHPSGAQVPPKSQDSGSSDCRASS